MPLKEKHGVSCSVVTAVKRYKPMRGSDSVLYSEDKERQREEKAKQMGLLCTYGQKGITT